VVRLTLVFICLGLSVAGCQDEPQLPGPDSPPRMGSNCFLQSGRSCYIGGPYQIPSICHCGNTNGTVR
jgi:hypothetical protein